MQDSLSRTPNGERNDEASAWHRGDWMQTFTGRQFYPMAPAPEDVDIIDIAHSLAMQCRYNGHVSRFYSVAEHCVLMSDWLLDNGASTTDARARLALWGLLHDATEAYVGDMVRPLKLQLPSFMEAEDRVELAIAERFGVTLTDDVHRAVKAVDTRILLNERAALLADPPRPWSTTGPPLDVTIRAWSPEMAKREYLARFERLTGQVSE